jgi:hypothetical protein
MFGKTLTAVAAVAFLLAGSASAQKLDANGRCHDASGKFAKAEVCGGAPSKTASASKTTSPAATPTKTASAKPAKSTGAASATTAATTASATAKAAPTKCKNDKGKYAKCGSPGAKPA